MGRIIDKSLLYQSEMYSACAMCFLALVLIVKCYILSLDFLYLVGRAV